MAGWQSCIAYAKRHKHPEFRTDDLGGFPGEQASLRNTRTIRWFCRRPSGYHHVPDHGRPNRYSVDARAAGRMVLVRSHLSASWFFSATVLPRDFRRYQSSTILGTICLCCAPAAHARRSGWHAAALPSSRELAACRRDQHSSSPRAYCSCLSAVEAACAEALAADRQRRRDPDRLARRHQPPRRLRSPRRMACA